MGTFFSFLAATHRESKLSSAAIQSYENMAASSSVLLKTSGGGAEPQEWTIVEMQGALETRVDTRRDLEIGTLSMNGKTPIMVIGNRRLEGEVVPLAKPFAVLEPDAETDAASKDGGSAEEDGAGASFVI